MKLYKNLNEFGSISLEKKSIKMNNRLFKEKHFIIHLC